MDALERLTLEQAEAHDLLACVHRHRYELAAELCGGLRVADIPCGSGYGSRILAEAGAEVTGVDNDAATIEAARAALGIVAGIEFECADVHEFLSRSLAGDFDAIVIFEGIEHVREPHVALEALERHAGQGMKVLVSIPNSRTLGEANPFHVTNFDYDAAMRAFDRFDDVVLLYQFNAEGSLIRGASGNDLGGRLALGERGEPDYCNNFIAVVNFADDELRRHAAATMQLEVAPTYNRYMVELLRANQELWRTNERLWRKRLGIADSAAASRIARRDAGRASGLAGRTLRLLARLVPAPLRPRARNAVQRVRALVDRLPGGGDRRASGQGG